ncbi:MAG TPA: YebC/PmpR family DNA-binding transcriptional regulator [Cryomorphaceae bacterium]|jgi:YebC/PmpR family DNA-binding regulatory protein|nr:YebC/PmpR family DNA-binding transcriptional regulator [Schleiferiaceae bacterium]HCY25088.1 YebC/PmpR family DNA-binding transcriptional regulator [Cryomorphaceae bacterium]|tara:strand:- start:2919 stop:3650 length:732 start_codon:yes stop_codon:yes gene_type:complete
MGRAFEFRKERKFKRWAGMAKTFSRITKDVIMAVKEGGDNPDSNYRLRLLYQNAKAANMPKENVERAIKKATSKDQADYKTIIYEGYAPHGIAVLVETATDNNIRTVANVRSYFNKLNGSFGTQGSVEFMFEHKCNCKIAADGIDIEELEFALIDFGIEDVFSDTEEKDGETLNIIMVYGQFSEFGNISRGLEELGHEILESGFEYIPTITKDITEEQVAEVAKLIEKLEEDDDVQNVYTTMR